MKSSLGVVETSDVTRDTVLVPDGTMLAVVDMTGLASARLTQEPDQVRGGAAVVKVPARCRRRKMVFSSEAAPSMEERDVGE
ncbi:hypothetical protein J3459_019289 [Metarhizium acridum]|nr:hypothetical protein J3459_019289 [Metarhizium acridum]